MALPQQGRPRLATGVVASAAGFGLGLLTQGPVSTLRARRRSEESQRARLGGLATQTSSHSHAAAVTREELGRCTWTLLHTLAAAFPASPSRRQQSDARELVHILSRLYPCRECASHFAELLRDHPPRVETGEQLSRWLCETHNSVSARLGKPAFNCARARARWAMEACHGDACGPAT